MLEQLCCGPPWTWRPVSDLGSRSPDGGASGSSSSSRTPRTPAVSGSSGSAHQAYEAWLEAVRRDEQDEVQRRARRARWEAEGKWSVVEGGGCVGLTNIRNTCWMNAVIQSLAHIEPFTAHFLPKPSSCGRRPSTLALNSSSSLATDAPGSLVKELQRLLQQLWQVQQSKAVVPLRFHSSLNANLPSVMKRAFKAQQDAQEFLLFFVNALHDELSAQGKCEDEDLNRDLGPCVTPSRTLRQFSRQFSVDAPSEGQQSIYAGHRGPINSSWISSTCQGQVLSSLSCMECGFISRTIEDFFHLSVPVRESWEPVNLDQALAAEFADEERLQGDNRWHCDRCCARVEASRRAFLHRLPPVIIGHLKRFSYTASGKAKKVRTPVILPSGGGQANALQQLDLSSYFSSPQEEPVLYDIVSIVNHHGRDAVSGHYTAHCRHCVDGQWYSFNDDRVQAIGLEEVWLPEEVYLFCLQRSRQVIDAR